MRDSDVENDCAVGEGDDDDGTYHPSLSASLPSGRCSKTLVPCSAAYSC